MSDPSVVVLFAHPALERSRVHRRLIEVPRQLPGVTVRDLYELYPDFEVDVAAEQAVLAAHDTIVLQHPLYWYSLPPLLRQWQDLVLTYGWAYGTHGTALVGKRLMHVLSAGGGQEAYQADGRNRFPLEVFLRPCEQTAVLCGMTWLPPWVVYGTHALSEAQIDERAAGYRDVLSRLASPADPADPTDPTDRSAHAR